MEYNILMNSQVINEWSETGAIDPTNAIILSLLAKYDNPHNKLEHDSEGYVWLNLSYLLGQVPWLGINEGTLGKRLKKLVDSGIIDKKQVKLQTGSKLYFKMSDLYRQMEAWYDELHTLESNGNISEIEKHYLEKPIVKGGESVKKVSHPHENAVPHPHENTGAHPDENAVPHPHENAGNPNTINPYTKRERKKDNTCIEEGPAEPEADAGQASLPLSEKSGEDTLERKAAKLVLWIEEKVEADKKGKFFILPEASREIKRFAILYGARWVAEEFKGYYKTKTPALVRRFMHEDFPRYLSKAEKNKSPPPVEYLIRRKCPACGYVLSGTMSGCRCGLDVENFDDPALVEEHKEWLKAREEQQELEVPSLFTEFKEKIRHDKTAG